MTVWRLDGTGNVIWSKPIFDALSPGESTTDTETLRSSQYPNITILSDDSIALVYSHQHGNNINNTFSMSVRASVFKNFLRPLAPEVTGAGETFKRGFAKNIRVPRTAFKMIYSTAPVPNMSLGNLQFITLTASTAVIGVPLNPLPWEELTLVFVQGGSGSYTATFNSIFEFGGITPSWQTAVNATNILRATYNPITNKWIVTEWR